MKRINGLFDKICTEENILLAYRNATRGKKHYKDVIAFNKDLKNNLKTLLIELKTLTYRTSPYYIFNLKTGGKVREIYKLPIRDRIAQHALMNYMEPIFRKSFIVDTYSSTKERGIHMGLRRLTKALKDKKNTVYCLKLDIHKFYPSINQELMKAALARKFKDKRLLIILEEIIDSTDKGVPIGNYTSQYFANFFLTPMDHWIKEVLRVKYYFRYCDDIVILGPTKEYLWNIFHKIQDYLKDIQLELKPNWQVFPVESRSVDFLGYKSRHEYILVKKYIKKNFINKLRQSNTFESKRNILGSYWGIFCHANCRNLWRTYTGMRTFKDLGIEVKTRVRVPDIVDKIIIINSMKVKFKRGNKCVDISATYEDREIKFTTFAEMIIEAAEQISNSDLPFETKIISKNGFYKFE